MFAVSVTAEQSEPIRDEASSVARRQVVKNGLLADVVLGPLYGLCRQEDELLIAGECLVPVETEVISRIAQRVTRGDCAGEALGSKVLLLVVVDFKTARVAAVSNISCSRPLYYQLAEGTFRCSTSIAALRELGVTIAPEERVVPEYLVYRYVAPPRTLIRDVKKLVGGQSLVLDLKAARVTSERFYAFSPTDIISDHQGFDPIPLKERLEGQVSMAMSHYDRPGLLLSGGVDSGLLGYLAKSVDNDIASSSSSFDFINPNDGERNYALSFAKQLGIEHHVHEGTAEGYLEGLVESIRIVEEPVHHLQSVMFHLLFKEFAVGRHDLLLCGEGADGIFGNDTHNFYYRHRDLFRTIGSLKANRALRYFKDLWDISDYRVALLSRETSGQLERSDHLLWTLGRYGDVPTVKAICGCREGDIISGRLAMMVPYHDAPLLDKTTILSLLGEGFVSMYVWSKLAESCGVVVQYPFTAGKVLDYVMDLTWSTKLKESKFCLKAMLRSYGCPEELVQRPKLSFAFPYRHWSLPGGLLQPLVDMATEKYDRTVLASLQTEKPGEAMVLWSMLNLYLWEKVVVEDGDPKDLSTELRERYRRMSC